MSETLRKIKANGHIAQADWDQTDPLQMDYIHNKPENIITADNINDNTNSTMIHIITWEDEDE
jgi:hypothetical protein